MGLGGEGFGRASEAGWLALYTEYQQEASVGNYLLAKRFDVFNPYYVASGERRDRAGVVRLPLFPGYVLVAGARKRRNELLTIPGVYTIVSFGREAAEIPAAEIEPIRRAMHSSMAVQPHPYLRSGEKATIATGPLAGVRGFLAPTEGHQEPSRLVLTVELISKSVAIELDAGCVCKPASMWNLFHPVWGEEALSN